MRANLEAVERRLRDACHRAGRPRDAVTLVAVSKFRPAERTLELHGLGQRHFGESRVQEAREKIPALPGDIEWHLIGRLQTNKAKYLPGLVGWLHALDRAELVEPLDAAFARKGGRLRCLVQVNIAGEEQKAGVEPGEAAALVRLAAARPTLEVVGLMTMAPLVDDPEAARPVFRALRELAERLRLDTGLPLPHLSMGMTNDFEIAVEEGATLVRVGTALYEG
ncbi:MAG: YggS family pyridoxal phosphate-dependent enzyme [Candidatus Sumerlaeia bacterium]|nr:YggS family pyridoxal phosphate-dependent enzyme [Candidatus Sumerlaeia bacterium]